MTDIEIRQLISKIELDIIKSIDGTDEEVEYIYACLVADLSIKLSKWLADGIK